jgi:hypothetical protein
MLSTQYGCDHQLKRVVDRLLKEDESCEHERRSVHRTPLVRPVTVLVAGDEERKLLGFSKNISPLGIGLILEAPLAVETIAKLSIHSLINRPVHIRSEVRWCKPFGNDWYLTGWRFITEVRA